jgi:hypothetical protein
MNRFSLLILVSLFFGILILSCQTKKLRRIDKELSSGFPSAKYMYSSEVYDSAITVFREKMKTYLKESVTFDKHLDSLSKYVIIRVSQDKKLKFYSWEDIHGGVRQSLNCVAQFKSKNGDIIVQELSCDINNDFTDSGIYKVYDIVYDSTIMYLTFAFGSYGGGNQHEIVQVFQIDGDILRKMTSCFEDSQDLVIEYPRWEKLDLLYDTINNAISFNEFVYGDIKPWKKSTGNRTILKLKGCKFIKEN